MATVLSSVQMDDKVTSYISKNRKMLINGQWVEAASVRATSTPRTIRPRRGPGSRSRGDSEDIDRAVKAARRIRDRPLVKNDALRARTPDLEAGRFAEQNLEEFAELECWTMASS
jgi:aldehyde dehydrogenase (NAD+)